MTIRALFFDMDGTLTVPNIDWKELRARVGVAEGVGIMEHIYALSGVEARRADLIVRVAPPLAGLEVALQAPIGNRVAVTVDGATQTADVTPDAVTRLTFHVDGVSALGAQSFVMTVTTSDGFVPRLRDRASRDPRFLGVAMELSPIVAGPDAPSGLSEP